MNLRAFVDVDAGALPASASGLGNSVPREPRVGHRLSKHPLSPDVVQANDDGLSLASAIDDGIGCLPSQERSGAAAEHWGFLRPSARESKAFPHTLIPVSHTSSIVDCDQLQFV